MQCNRFLPSFKCNPFFVLALMTALWFGCGVQRADAQSYGFWYFSKAKTTVPFGKSIPVHGEAAKFQFAPAIPKWPSSAWTMTKSQGEPAYKEPSRLCGTTIECLKGADFAFFLTELRIPAGKTATSFQLRAYKIDEGIRVTIYNALHPQGISPQAGFLRQDQMKTTEPHKNSATTGELASYLDTASTNVIVVTVIDDCCSAISVDKIELLWDGQPIASRNTAPELVSTPNPYAWPKKPYRYLVRMWEYDQEAVTFSFLSNPPGATIDAKTGWVTWQPTASDVGNKYSFSVKGCDPNGACRSHDWSVTVEAQSRNKAPSLSSSPVRQVQEVRNYRYDLVIRDPNTWDWTTVKITKGPKDAKVVRTPTGQYIGWLPPAGSTNLSQPFAIEACDYEGSCTSQSWLVTVTPNRPPSISNIPPVQAFFGQSYEYIPTVSDPDVEEKFTWKMIDGPPVYFFPVNGRVVWTPKREHIGKSWKLTMEVCDREALCSRKVWTVSVTEPVVSFSVISSPEQTAEVGKAYTYQLAIGPKEVTLDMLEMKMTKGPSAAAFDSTTGLVEWTPEAKDAGTVADFTLSLCTQGKCTEHIWKVNVPSLNKKPEFLSTPPKQAYMLTLYSYQIQAQDTDSTDILYYALRKAPEGVSFDISTGLLTWTPAENDAETKVSITVAACDLEDACVEQSWELPVSRNRPPQIRSTPGNKAWSGQEYTYQMDAVDPDTGDILSYKMTKGPASIKVDTKTGLMTWTPTEDDSKEAVDLVMEVCDQDDVCVPQDWKVEVDIPNKPPQITSTPTDSIVAGMTYQYDIVATDPNVGDTVTLKLKQVPPASVIEGSKLTWKSTSTDVGEHSFQVEACDKEGLCVEQRWSITVEAPPTEPTSSEPTVDAGPTDGGNTTDEPPKQVGCSVSGTTGGSSGGWLVLFAWLVLFVRRRQVSLSN